MGAEANIAVHVAEMGIICQSMVSPYPPRNSRARAFA